MTPAPGNGPKRAPIALTTGSRVRVLSAGPSDSSLESIGTYRGLVSIGGDNSLAIELSAEGEEHGRIRLVPLAALLAIDVLEAAKAEEEKRADKAPNPGYFG